MGDRERERERERAPASCSDRWVGRTIGFPELSVVIFGGAEGRRSDGGKTDLYEICTDKKHGFPD